MTSINIFKRKALRSGAALQALALLGAGVATIGAFATPASAQDYTNVTASGRVLSTSGEAISGATVEVKSDGQGFTRTVTTDNSGSFRVPQIPAGNYTFSITAPSFDAYSESGIPITLTSSANQFTLSPAGSASTGGDIVVTAGRIQTVDFDRSTTGQVINVGELATRVPVARDLTSVILLAPGTTAGDSAFGNLPNLAGASVAENAYYINGLNLSQFRQGLAPVAVPFDFYQTIDIKTGGYSAEFGRATGGIIVATTKSGSNEFHGSVTFNWEPNELASKAPNTLFADNDNDYRSRKDTIFQLSGPIIKDRLFVYGIYNARDVETRDGSTNAASPAGVYPNFNVSGNNYIIDRNRSPFWGAKVDAIPFDGQRLEFTYFDSNATTNRRVFGSVGTSNVTCTDPRRYCAATNSIGTFGSAVRFRSGGENYVGRYTGQFTNWLTLSGAYGKNKQVSTTEAGDTSLSSIIDSRPGAGNAQLGNPTANSDFNFDEREFYRGDVDLFFNLFGSHHIKGGYDRENLTANAATTANGGYQQTLNTGTAATLGTLGIPAGQQYVVSRFFRNGGIFTSKNEAFYIQDSWSLFSNRVNLQLGLRNDKFQNSNADGVVFYKSGDQWGPRIGVSIDPFGNNKTKVFGNFGRYFLPVAGNTNIRLAGAELDYDRYNVLTGLDANNRPIIGAPIAILNGSACPDTNGPNCRIRSDGVATDTRATVAGNLKPQSVDEYIVGIEQRFSSRLKATLTYTRSRLNDALEDAAVDPAIRAYCASNSSLNAAQKTFCAGNWSGTHQYVLINPGRDSVVTLSDLLPGETTLRTINLSAAALTYPRAERQYDAATFQFDREFDGVWSLSGSYTWTRLRGNYEGGVKSDNGQSDTGLTTDFDLPGLAVGQFGPSPNERTHNFKLFGSYKLTDWFTFGANGQITSPRKFGCIGLTPATVDLDANLFYGANGRFCNVNSSGGIVTDPFAAASSYTLRQVDRGSAFQSDWLYNLNLDFNVRIPVDTFDANLRFSVFNVLNSKSKLDFVEVGTNAAGTPSATYGQVNQYQAPRAARIQLNVGF